MKGDLIFLKGINGAVELNKVERGSKSRWQAPGFMRQE